MNSDIEKKMQKSLEAMDAKLQNIRAGRANPAMLNGIQVNYYGAMSPVSSLANITVPEARQLMIKPFDKSALKEIERSINEANLGITPINNGEVIILTIPELTEERRRDYVKQAKTICEETRVALRNIRQDANNEIKRSEMPEDEEKAELEMVQDLVNQYNKMIDERLKVKENELMSF
ncbi:MAG: ribosome recycling factor [Bacilli bacterium]|jgi:ribosome recycling factor|nr:ribosome recycling factor [Bacilli bacterium]